MKYSISDKRELTKSETEFLNNLFGKEKPKWSDLIEKGSLIIDYVGKSKHEELIGISVFGTKKMPTESEFYSINGKSDIIELPSIIN